MDEKAICVPSAVKDAEGNLYIPVRPLPYDGGMIRWTAEKITPDGRRVSGFMAEEFCPRAFLPYLNRDAQTGQWIFAGGSPETERMFSAAKARFFTLMAGTSPKFPPRKPAGTDGGVWIVETGPAVPLRAFAERHFEAVPTASYVIQCLRILEGLARHLKALRRDRAVLRLSPDTALLFPDSRGMTVGFTDPAYLPPRTALPVLFSDYPLSMFGWDAATDHYADPAVLSAFRSACVNGAADSSALGGACGLHSAAQLLCFLLFQKTWAPSPETLFIRFPAVGVLRKEALRGQLEAIAALGLGVGQSGARDEDALSHFSGMIGNALRLAETEAAFAF